MSHPNASTVAGATSTSGGPITAWLRKYRPRHDLSLNEAVDENDRSGARIQPLGHGLAASTKQRRGGEHSIGRPEARMTVETHPQSPASCLSTVLRGLADHGLRTATRSLITTTRRAGIQNDARCGATFRCGGYSPADPRLLDECFCSTAAPTLMTRRSQHDRDTAFGWAANGLRIYRDPSSPF
ncbi:hypothetical protein J7T55_014079 [Diaporthe amygdali]|uniref:uncharacterized protein n=1 Tax=Phomopsis amygdali TaxID=1214568 RepID=UPI0022FE5EE7|nr:uncharacterized protein J7T55_014079 [Diaporthe amygdali]KAJ0109517.1 hypothetical protein J7T55_014079 [Diaporthe amygdali]